LSAAEAQSQSRIQHTFLEAQILARFGNSEKQRIEMMADQTSYVPVSDRPIIKPTE
jgi:hypothetical protein